MRKTWKCVVNLVTANDILKSCLHGATIEKNYYSSYGALCPISAETFSAVYEQKEISDEEFIIGRIAACDVS